MKVLVTAGPTQEAIDPVRFISNRSSGKMGYALARVAADRGHEVRLISGPVSLQPPNGVGVTPVVSAQDMLAAVERNLDWCDVLIMCAAVADWRPRNPAAGKLKKGGGAPTLELEPTPDILRRVAPRKGGRIFVGFAAETEDPESEARRKLREKSLDLIVANDVARPDSGFGADTNKVVLFSRDGGKHDLPVMSKQEVARHVMEWVEGQGKNAERIGS